MRIKVLFFCLLIITATGLYFWNGVTKPLGKTVPESKIQEAPSLESSPENPQARADYQNRMLLSPLTGTIPKNIRTRELAFSELQLKANSIPPGFRIFEINNWKERGPINVGGRTRGVVIDTENENRLLSGGVSGGIWRSEEGGSSWERVTEPSSLHSVTSLAQDTRPGKTNIWFYGTGELVGNTARAASAPFRGDGLLRSTDNGLTWFKLRQTSSSQPHLFDNQYNYVWNIALDPNDMVKDVVYAAIFGAIARSFNGANWSIVLGPDYGFDTNLNEQLASFHTDVAVTPDGVVYATLSEFSNDNEQSSPNQGIYRSTNQGITWIKITPSGWPVNYRRTVIGISPSDPRIVYFLVDTGDEGEGEIWRLDDNPSNGTAIWDNRSESLPNFGGSVGDFDTQNSYNMVVKIHPEDPDIVFIGGTNLYRSTDGFSSTENTDWVGGYHTINDNSVYPGHHPDQHSLHFYPSNPSKALSSHDGGVSITENILADSVIWRKINNRYITSQFYTVAMDESGTNDIVLGGMQDNGTYLTLNDDSSVPWSRIIGGDGAFAEISRDGLFYYVSFQNSQIFRLTFNEQFSLTSFARVDPIGAGQTPNQEYLFINPFVLDPNNSNIMYLAGGDMIWRNQNLSQIPSGSNDPTSINWKGLSNTDQGSGIISALDVSTQPKDVLYFGTSRRRIFRVDNAASPSNQVTELTDFDLFPNDGYVSSIAVDPSNSDQVMFSYSNYEVQSIFYSTDGGDSFIPVGGSLEEFPDGTGDGPSIRWVKIIPLTNNQYIYLAATSTGLYSTSELDGMNTVWVQESPDEIGNKVVTMIKYRSTDGKVLVATHGSGIYDATINSTLPIDKDIGELTLALGLPYPNPFQDIVNIPYNLPENEIISVEILNALGQSVKMLFTGSQLSGSNILSWDGTNSAGIPVPDGVYICSLIFKDRRVSTRVILTRTQ